MNFRDDLSDYFYQEKNLNSNRQLNGVYKDLSKPAASPQLLLQVYGDFWKSH